VISLYRRQISTTMDAMDTIYGDNDDDYDDDTTTLAAATASTTTAAAAAAAVRSTRTTTIPNSFTSTIADATTV
jgi:hypothetical protein